MNKKNKYTINFYLLLQLKLARGLNRFGLFIAYIFEIVLTSLNTVESFTLHEPNFSYD